ncbi:DUF1501 domain-containing protein [Quatrionicoccus australiensis]|uniref:DUF1501 domain-containing protein n=1 Tax=Quatrionicoccus australiensis TaxID=138118 RepID=UPI001CFA8129|nr:DUF1501 domain-containing protein [Quatrionicoccus australiensis]MCB4358840.1 DUF1501 domain-containing protein [Quatrionicoccus australiensis]
MSINRRDFLIKSGLGLGGAAASGFIPGIGFINAASAADLANPLAPKSPHFPAKVKSVIWLHQNGAPSTLDLYDYKPELIKLAGKETPASFMKGIKTSTQGGVGKLFASDKRTWKQYGDSGAWFSNLLPNLAEHADKIAFIKSSVTVGATHDISILKLNTGDVNPGRPSLGAWVNYALGSLNPDLPSYVVLYNGDREPSAGSVNWSSGFLPAVYQGTPFRPGDSPILYLERPELRSVAQQRGSLDLLKTLNRIGADRRPEDSELRARLESYELADRMQRAAPEAVDLDKESDATKKLYGLDDKTSESYGKVLLRARRLVERGVRFVHVVSGHPENVSDNERRSWDAHSDLEGNHGTQARMVDKPIAGLLADLKSRGLLESTLVVWTSEFGRTSWGESGTGRDHNPWGYTQWMAGAGVKAGYTHGATDEIGLQVADKDTAVDTYDLHATVLHLLGLDHLKTTFLNNGRSERPTVVYGKVIKELLA